MDLSKLGGGEKVVSGAGSLLVLDLLFFPWYSGPITVDVRGATFSGTDTVTAIESPHAFWGIAALLLTTATVASVLISRYSTARLPPLPVPWPRAVFLAGGAVAALLLLKLLIETRNLGFGAGLGMLLGMAMAYGGFLVRQEAEPPDVGPPAPPGG